MDKEKFKEFCSLYFLNDINEKEFAEMKAVLDSGDPEFQKIYHNMKNVFLHLSLAAELTEPPQRIKEKIFSEIHGEDIYQSVKISEKLAGFLGLNRPVLSLAVILILFVGVVTLAFYLTEMIQKIKIQKTEIVELKNNIERKNELLNILESKEIEVVIMNGLDVNPAGYGKILWNPETKSAILQVSNLPVINKGKNYQLWLIKNNIPVSAGVFDISEEKENFFKIENLAETEKQNINAFAVTLEPKGGTAQPTGEMYLLGKPLNNN
jgi:hypothetical protein